MATAMATAAQAAMEVRVDGCLVQGMQGGAVLHVANHHVLAKALSTT